MRILSISCLALLSFSAWSETVKIGYIDTQKIFSNLPQYQQSVDEISKEFEPKKQELLDLFKHIELLRVKINTINKSEKKRKSSIRDI
jgi:outer membrane protein